MDGHVLYHRGRAGPISADQTPGAGARDGELPPADPHSVPAGRVYRKDEIDATHSPMFHQMEGLVIDKGITMGDLKGTLNTLMKSSTVPIP